MRGAKVFFLNVGWGDAHVIETPAGKLTLIDGGDGKPGEDEDTPLGWMDRTGFEALEWMILTHVHEDHMNGLLPVAERKRVAHAVLPYRPFPWADTRAAAERLEGFDAGDASESLRSILALAGRYLELIRLLENQGTRIVYRDELSPEDNQTVWKESGFTLRHLYPWKGDPLPAWTILQAALDNRAPGNDEWLEGLRQFFLRSNADCSVYLLDGPEDAASLEEEAYRRVLFGGDLIEQAWASVHARATLEHAVWKVPHHGMPDALTCATMELVQPAACVIPVTPARSGDMAAHWDRLREKANIPWVLTGEFPKGSCLRMAESPFEIIIGSN